MGSLIIYNNWMDGINDTIPFDNMKDTELMECDNALVFSRGGLKFRNGASKVNNSSLGGEVDQGISWVLSDGKEKLLYIVNNELWEYLPYAPNVKRYTFPRTFSTPLGHFVYKDKLYFTDGVNYKVWGDFDYYTNSGTKSLTGGKEIIKNFPLSTGANCGVPNHFYRPKANMTNVDLSSANYGDTTVWENVTDGVVVSAATGTYDYTTLTVPPKIYAGKKVLNSPISTGTKTGILNHIYMATTLVYAPVVAGAIDFGDTNYWVDVTTYNVDITNAYPIPNVIRDVTPYTDAYDYTTASGTVTVTTGKKVLNQPVSTAATLAGTAYHVYQAKSDLGSINLATAQFGDTTKWVDISTNELSPIKKCKYFVYHPSSLRIFASGNPDDPTALYYSESDSPNYFKAVSKLYPTTAHGPVLGLSIFIKSVMVSYKTSWRVWSGVSVATDATWKELPIPQGVVSNQAMCLTPNSMTFFSYDGLITVSPSIINDDIVMVYSTDFYANLTERRVEGIVKSVVHPETVKLTYHDGYVYMAYSDDIDNPRNNRVLVMSWAEKSFVRFTGWQVNDWVKTNDGRLLFASKNYVLEALKGTNDVDVETGLDTSVKVRVVLKPYMLGSYSSSFNQKYLNRLLISGMQNYDQSVAAMVKVYVNSDYIKTKFYDAQMNNSFTWGNTWGLGWGNLNLVTLQGQVNLLAFRHQVILESDILNNPATVNSIGFDYETNDASGARQMSVMPLIKDYE